MRALHLTTVLTAPERELIEGADDRDDVCHVAVTGSSSIALCGQTLKTAAADRDGPPHRGAVVNGFCSGCGRKICVTCESLNDRELLLLGHGSE